MPATPRPTIRKYVVVVMIEQGGHGGAAAAPAAKLIYNALFNIKGGSTAGAVQERLISEEVLVRRSDCSGHDSRVL